MKTRATFLSFGGFSFGRESTLVQGRRANGQFYFPILIVHLSRTDNPPFRASISGRVVAQPIVLTTLYTSE